MTMLPSTLPLRAEAAPYKPLFDTGNDLLTSGDFDRAKFSQSERDAMLNVVQQAIDDVLTVVGSIIPTMLPPRLPIYFGKSNSFQSTLVTGNHQTYSPNENGEMLSTVPPIEGILLHHITPDTLRTPQGIADIRQRVHTMTLHAAFHPTINVALKSVRNAIVYSLGSHLFGEHAQKQHGQSTTGFVTPDSKEIYFEDGLFDVLDSCATGDLQCAPPPLLLQGLLSIHEWQKEIDFADPDGNLLYPPNAVVLEGMTLPFPASLRPEIRDLPSLRAIQTGNHLACKGDDAHLYITDFTVTENAEELTNPHSHNIRLNQHSRFAVMMSLVDEQRNNLCKKLFIVKDTPLFHLPFQEYMRTLFDKTDIAHARTLHIQLAPHNTTKGIALEYDVSPN